MAREVRGELGKLWAGVTVWEFLGQTRCNIQIQTFSVKSKYLAYLKKLEAEATLGLYAHVMIATWSWAVAVLFRQSIMFQAAKGPISPYCSSNNQAEMFSIALKMPLT